MNWSFNSGSESFDYLSAGETLTLTYTVRATDSNSPAAIHERTVIITITGTNDAPVIATGAGTASLTETNSTLTAGGSFAVEDLDYSNTVTASVRSVVSSGITAGILADNSQLLAMLSVDAGNILTATSTLGTMNWSFNSGSQAFDYLAQGETLTLTYTVRATDSNSPAAIHERTVIITVTGTNDAPVIATGAGTASLTETNSTLTAGGTFAVEDLDYSNTVTASVRSVTATGITAGILADNPQLLAMLSVDAGNILTATSTLGTMNWSFNSGSQAFDYLAQGETLTLTYMVRATDSNSPAAIHERTVIITITGTNDAPVIATGAGIASLTETNSTLTAGGTFAVEDLDYSNTVTASVRSASWRIMPPC
jgi:VCBS repeat-containing protein